MLFPFDGSITKSYIDISTNVNIGTPIIDIIRDGKKEVELNISSRDRKLISVGNLVTLTDDNEIQYKGFVSRIGNFVNTETQNISVFVEIPKKSNDGYLFNGMYLNVKLKLTLKLKFVLFQEDH